MIQFLLLLCLAAVLASLVILLGRNLVFAVTMLHGPVFVPSADDRLATMLQLAQVKNGERVIDIGAGDGKVVIALAKKGIKAEGVELNPILVRRAYKQITEQKLDQMATVFRGDLWKIDYSKYDVVLFYGTSYVMQKLENKLMQEMKPGSRVVSNYFQFPNWKAKQRRNEVSLYIK